MTTLEKVKKAQDDWQEPVNKAIDAVNGLLGGRTHPSC